MREAGQPETAFDQLVVAFLRIFARLEHPSDTSLIAVLHCCFNRGDSALDAVTDE
jgi:hypothetical protein